MTSARADSIHARILGDIEGKILSGEWRPGHRIPFEHELSASYGCARMTVNKALTQLARAGLIERRRRVGSFVAQPPSRSALLEIPEIRVEVESLGLPYRFEVLHRRRRAAKASDAGALEGLDGGDVLELVCRHWAGERPFCLEERLINLAQAPEAELERFEDHAPGAWLLSRAPWTSAEHRIRARAADAKTAKRMEVQAGAPCLSVERRTWSGAAPVTYVKLTYPGESHELVARFLPTRGQRANPI
jgi:GntR family transcriptional regulator, histidine utilization repressor